MSGLTDFSHWLKYKINQCLILTLFTEAMVKFFSIFKFFALFEHFISKENALSNVDVDENAAVFFLPQVT